MTAGGHQFPVDNNSQAITGHRSQEMVVAERVTGGVRARPWEM